MLRHIVPSRESRPLTPPPEALLFEKLLQICLRRGDGRNTEVVYKIVQYVGRKERRERGAETNVPDAQMQQRQQDADRLLLIPRKHHGKRQLVHAAAERVRKRKRDLNGTVGVVALADVHQARQSADRAEIEVVEAVLAAGKRQNNGVGRRLLDKFRIVVTAGACSVAACDKEEMPDGPGLDGLDDRVCRTCLLYTSPSPRDS